MKNFLILFLFFLLINEDFLILHVLLPKNARNGMNTPTGAWTNPKNFDLNKNFNMNLISIETWNLRLETGNWNLELNLEIETWNWSLKNLILKLDIETWNWNLKLKLEIQTSDWNSKSRLEIEAWNWIRKSNPEIESWNWIV